MDQATTARTDSRPPRLAPILSLADVFRRGADAVITTGELFHVPLRKAKPRPPPPVWLPRKPTKTGRERFVQIEDRLVLAIFNAKLPPAAFSLLWAITFRQLSQYHRDGEIEMVPIGLDELCAVTAYKKTVVCEALNKLEERHIIERTSGGGRHLRTGYLVADPEDWEC